MAAREVIQQDEVEIEGVTARPYSVYSVTPHDDGSSLQNVRRQSTFAESPKALKGPIQLRTPYVIQRSYLAQETDEISINPGNTIQVLKVYDDGWCLVVSLETNVKGVIPADCLL